MRSRPVSRGQPQTVQPCIAELLRTCVDPPILVLRVEKILEDTIEKSRPPEHKADVNFDTDDSKSAYKLYLGDGEIMIQALLAPHLHPLIDLRETTDGSLIELRNYTICKAPRRSSKGDVIYLGVQDFVCITLSRPTTRDVHEDVLESGGGFMIDEDMVATQKQPSTYVQVPSSPVQEMASQLLSSQESCAYETIKVDPETVKKRRQALHEMSSNAWARRMQEDEDVTPIKRPRYEINDFASSQGSDGEISGAEQSKLKRRLAPHELSDNKALSRGHRNDDSTPTKHSIHSTNSGEDASSKIMRDTGLCSAAATDDTPSPSQHTLLSLLHPPTPLPPRNYPVTVLAAISWISPSIIHQPGSPFPPKRTLKVHDPSISDRQVGISISVFIDAESFRPRHGTIALFRGVVMQMWKDEVILNAYSNLRERGWYVDDERELKGLGYDVKGMKVWWKERKRSRAAAAAAGGKEGTSGRV